ncbi:MAG: peptidase T [Lachnospiraceae bacterium]
MAEKVMDKFLRYVVIDTESKEDQEMVPSTKTQRVLAELLVEELRGMGASEVTIDEHCYVMAVIPATTSKEVPALGLIAHMDTAPAFSGKDVRPQIIEGYDGGEILLNRESGLKLSPQAFPELLRYVGDDLITTDGTTLLGADDKAGIAEIMVMAEYLLAHPEIAHGKICIGFTPDEEVGRGADYFDVKKFGADVAYTVDGGAIGELEYENFNAASARVKVQGLSVHPGSAKGMMKNALLIGMELQAMLPAAEDPMYTDGYEGFYHLHGMSGDVDQAKMNYIIRDHDHETFEGKKQLIQNAVDFLNTKYGAGTVAVQLTDSYYNMKEVVEPHRYLITLAEEAMRELNIEPLISPIRGGTDGARLSFMGLPCPNLCAGGHNFHGRYEFVSVQSMERIVLLLVKLVEMFASH